MANKPVDNDSLATIATELTTIRKLLFEKVRFQMGIDADVLKQLTNIKGVSNDKSQTKKKAAL